MLENEKEVRQWHSLCNREIDFYISWQNWKEGMAKAQKAHEILGLLHYGFDIDTQGNEDQERIICYLEIAYGYDSSRLFSLPSERRDEEFHNIFGWCTKAEARAKVARKAWTMLCQKVFKNTEKGDFRNPSWWEIITRDPQLLDKILWFFSERDNIPRGISLNEHNNQIAVDFLYTLAKYAWIRHSSRHSYGDEPLSNFVDNRPRFIKILLYLGRLNFLALNWGRVTKKDLAVLEELALCEDGKKSGEKKYKTISEAAISNNENNHEAARILITLKPMIEEKKRQEKAMELERKIKEIEVERKALEA
jgi:hypothetical protein